MACSCTIYDRTEGVFMIFTFHIFYFMLWIPLIISLMFFKSDAEEFCKLKKGLQFYYKLFPYLCMLLIYLYPFMHAEVFTDSPVAFTKRLGFLLIGATYVNVLIILLRIDSVSKFSAWGLCSLGYLALMVGWNIYIHSTTLKFILNIVIAVVANLPLYLVAVIVSAMALTQTKEQREAAAEHKARRQQILAKQEAERLANEDRRRKEQEARDAYNRQLSEQLHLNDASKKTPYRPNQVQWSQPSQNWDSDSKEPERKSFWERLTEGDRNADIASGSNCCNNCSHYRGGCCQNPASNAYGQFILLSGSHSCIFHG